MSSINHIHTNSCSQARRKLFRGKVASDNVAEYRALLEIDIQNVSQRIRNWIQFAPNKIKLEVLCYSALNIQV